MRGPCGARRDLLAFTLLPMEELRAAFVKLQSFRTHLSPRPFFGPLSVQRPYIGEDHFSGEADQHCEQCRANVPPY